MRNVAVLLIVLILCIGCSPAVMTTADQEFIESSTVSIEESFNQGLGEGTLTIQIADFISEYQSADLRIRYGFPNNEWEQLSLRYTNGPDGGYRVDLVNNPTINDPQWDDVFPVADGGTLQLSWRGVTPDVYVGITTAEREVRVLGFPIH